MSHFFLFSIAFIIVNYKALIYSLIKKEVKLVLLSYLFNINIKVLFNNFKLTL